MSASLGRVAHHYPLSLAGTLLLALIAPLLVRSLRVTNPYGTLVSLAGLLILTLLAIAGRIQANRYDPQPVQWDSGRPVFARAKGSAHSVELPAMGLLPFFRVHLELTGRLRVGRRASIGYFQEAISNDGRTVHVPWDLPLSGILLVDGRLSVKDLFGLTRSRFGPVHSRSIVVRPAPFPEISPTQLSAMRGEEETARQTQADEERYFMREYVPGDRFRDINWKASSRLSELVTRISPLTQEKTQLIQVEFRHFTGAKKDDLQSVIHLDFLKSWLVTFLRRQMRDNPRFRFRVITGQGIHELAEEADVDSFSQDLAMLFFGPDPGTDIGREDGGAVFFFSTPYDPTINHGLAAYRRADAFVYRTTGGARAGRRRTQAGSDEAQSDSPRDDKTTRIRLGRWLLGGASPLLPGIWVARGRSVPDRPVALAPGRLLEAPLDITFFG
jgi:hypothetical protein